MYDSGRYFTMTGDHLEGTPATIENRQAELEALHGEIFGKDHASSTRTHRDTTASLGISDKELIAKANNARNGLSFSKLWAGYWIGDYPSQSEADQALCNSLAAAGLPGSLLPGRIHHRGLVRGFPGLRVLG
jgi:putative DNA primase/helicase